MRSCGAGPVRRAFASISKKSPKHSKQTGFGDQPPRKEFEEAVMSRMMGTISSQHASPSAASPSSPVLNSLVQATSTTTSASTAGGVSSSSTEDTVIKSVANGKLNFLQHHYSQNNTTTIVPKPGVSSPSRKQIDQQSKPSAITFERGIFESLNQVNDVFQRPGFDRVVASQILNDVWLVGVIDGHGHSPICAEYLAESFPVVVRLLLERPVPGTSQAPASPTQPAHSSRFHFNLGSHNHHHNHTQNQEAEKKTNSADGGLRDAHGSYYCEVLKEAFKICSREWDSSPEIKSSEQYRNSGAVALLALVHTSRQQLYMANAGDCRALVSQTTGRGYRFVHSAHRTDNVKERLRVLQQGGKIKSVQGVPRVGGSLIPTRVFGDVGLKLDFFGRLRNFLDPNPEVATVEVSQAARDLVLSANKGGSKQCAFTVLASDGLWDTLSTENVVEICTEALSANKSAEEIARLLGTASMQSTDDDVSIVVLVW